MSLCGESNRKLYKLLVAFCTGEYNINPYPHNFGRGCDQIVHAVKCLHAERQRRVRALYTLQMVYVHFLDCLEVDAATWLRFRVVCIVDERALRAVEDEPAFVPRLELVPHLV